MLIERLLDRLANRHLSACVALVLVVLAANLPGFAGLFPMDRDEPRFAQASKQMLETGDYVDIRLQDEARNKKPVGIYWLQANAVSLGGLMGVPDARGRLWLYRLPSLVGAITAVLLTYWTALALTTRRAALLAAALLAVCVVLVVEAHLAKTDAALLATVVAAMGVLARAWRRREEAAPLERRLCAVFWTAIGAGILIKGPITPMIPLFAAVVLSLRHRSARWLLALRPWQGLAWVVLIALPWFILIVSRSGTAFFSESIGHDMAGKVAGVQEAHGAPPGSYLLAFWITAWPLAPFVLLGAVAVWRRRWSDPVLFLLAWLAPTWLLFEAVPTKLPHYVLPVYPALAILAAMAAQDREARAPVRGGLLVAFSILLALLPAALPIALFAALGRATSALSPATIALAALAFCVAAAAVAAAIRSVREGRVPAAMLASIAAALAVYGFVLGWFMDPIHADLLALSPRLATAGRAGAGPSCPDPAFATVGDREPSLVFLTRTDLLMTDAAGAATFLAGGPCRVAFVDGADESAFATALGASPVRLAARVAGLNINGGKKLDIGVYVRQDPAP